MKLVSILLLLLVALVSADTYEDYQNDYTQGVSAPSNYYRRRSRPSNGGLTGLVKRFFGFGGNRRQLNTGTGFTGTGAVGTGGGLAGGPFLGAPAGGLTAGSLAPYLLIGGLFLLAALGLIGALATINFNSSGRGLDTDEWEVDHSVWMEQLQKDFEDSWSTE